MEARRGAGGGGNAPRAGRCLMERSAGASRRRKATTRDPSRALKRPVCLYGSSIVACATPAPGQSPVRAEGKPSPRAGAPGGCAPRRPCRAATASPGPPRPPASHRLRWERARRPVPRPACRPARPGPRTAASPGPSTRRRPHRAWCGSAFVVSVPARTANALSTSPACLSRRASWRLLATLAVSVA